MSLLLFRRGLAVAVAGLVLLSRSDAVEAAAPTVLSEQGSGRGTAYLEQNKIVTVGDRTHVAWLDADPAGFRVRIRTLDRKTGHWSPSVLVGEAQDNHGGPALTVDGSGYLHIVYYPHHGAIRYRRSLRPNDASAWETEIPFGEGLTYPALLCAPDGTLVLVARRGYYDVAGKAIEGKRIELELWKKPPGADWERRATLLRSRVPGYAQFAASLAWGPDGRMLHLSCRIYEGTPFKIAPERYTVGYLQSPDAGETWRKADGSAVALPADADSVDVLATEKDTEGPRLHVGGMAVDRAGVPHLLYSSTYHGKSQLYLATPAPGLGWTRRDLMADLPDGWREAVVYGNMGSGITFSESGRATIVASLQRLSPEDAPDPMKAWGSPSSEVVRLWSDDGLKTLHSEILAPLDPAVPHWLPNLERATGHNLVPEEPGILYTAGIPGKGLKDLDLNTRILWRTRN